MHDPTRPNVEERYSAAIESSDLQVLPTRCSVDYLVAAGWCHEGLGTALVRLRTEYDAARGEMRLAESNATSGARRSATLVRAAALVERKAADEADSKKAGRMVESAAATRRNADEIRRETERAALTARALIMVQLGNLTPTANAVYAFAVGLGARVGFTNAKALREIAPRALQLWLDPDCPHCNGLGHRGGALEVLRWCHECDKTGKRIYGKRPFRMHRSDSGHEFGRRLLSELDAKCQHINDAMKRYLHSHRGPDEKVSTAQAAALKTRLAELRSAQAQED